MVVRPSSRPLIEKWNRAELEDNYHLVLEQMRTCQKKNNDLEKKVTQLNSKFRRAVMERRPREGETIEKEKYDQLANENQLLSMKLKTVKHQLLTYTTPTARAATALAMTGRSTFRSPSTFRRAPPSSASIDESQSSRRTARPNTAGTDNGSKSRLKPDEAMEIPTRHGGGGSVRIVEGGVGSHHEKAMVIRLNRQIKEKNGQINNLQYEVESSKAEIERLKEDLEQKAEQLLELSNKKGEDIVSKESWMETEILQRELIQLKEELHLVTAANERLVKQSLANEMAGNEREMIEMKKKIIELEENLKDRERRAREAEKKLRQERRQIQGMKERERKRVTVEQSKQTTNASGAMEQDEDYHYRPIQKYRKTKEVDTVLNKLYQDISKLLESHEAKDVDDAISLEISETQKLAKWQKMYSELYEELEKVRNMLLLQHNINQKQTSEINLLRDECDRLKLVGEQKLDQLKKTLQEKQKHVDVLQQQIHEIAYSGQKPIPLKAFTPKESELSTRLSLRLTGIKFSNTRGATSIFMSLEFFDFELQTTPILRAIDQPLDFMTSYDVVISNLFMHYLQTNGITVELYRAKNASYEFLGAGTVSLNELLGRKGDALLGGHLSLREIETGHVLATLSYELSTTKELGEALGAYRRAETAQKLIPLPEKKPNLEWHELIVSVTKCTGLGSISSEPMEVCLVYELLAFSPYATDNIIGTGTVNFQNEKRWNLPNEALQYFSDQNINFYLMDRGAKKTEEGVIRMMSLPLSPLLQNSIISGSFAMVEADGSETGVKLDVEIKWAVPLPRIISVEKAVPQPEKIFLPSLPEIPLSPPKPPRVMDVPPEEIPEETYSEKDIESILSSDRADTEETVKEIEKVSEHDIPEEIATWENLPDVPDYLRTSSEESQDTYTKEIREEEIEEEEHLLEKEAKESSHLSGLPALPPVAKPRLSRTYTSIESEEDTRDHLVGFSSPLHHSIPPSDTSSVASPRREKTPVKLPNEGGRSAIKTVDRVEEEPRDTGDEGTVTISILAIRNTAYSPLMERRFEGVKFFVDWKFLDFPDEECRVTESQPLPVIWDEPIIFDFTKEYHLSRRKVALLEQYIENQNHMEFCLVTDAGLDSEELAVASLELMRIPPDDTLLIPLLDVNGVRWADLEMSLSYSENIFNTHESDE